MQTLYDEVAQRLDGEKSLLELYSGVGLLTAQILTRLKELRITAVEIEKSAVADAKKLMADLGLSDRAEEICADASEFIDKSKSEKGVLCGFDSVILDPPRKGCDKSVLDAVMRAEPDRAIYVSCNPATLARDLKILSEKFRIVGVTPSNMFPRTAELETLCELEFVK